MEKNTKGVGKVKAKLPEKALMEDLVCEIYDNLAARMVVALYRERDRARRSYGKLSPPKKIKKVLKSRTK